MPLETATYPTDLVTSNPAASDGMNNADDHMRLTKAVLKNVLAGVNAALTRVIATTSFGLILPAGSLTEPSYAFAAEPTLGLYRSAAGVISVAGGRLKGALPAGGLHEFLVAPAGLGAGAVGTGHEYLELDGSTWPNASFPDLAAHLGQGGTTFTLPDVKTLGRFKRSRTASVAAGTLQADTVGAHTHPNVTATSGANSVDHTHTVSGTTGNDSPDHTHAGVAVSNTGSTTGGGGFSIAGSITYGASAGASVRHQHAFSTTSAGQSVVHTHDTVVSTPANTGTTETRPVSLSVISCIKT